MDSDILSISTDDSAEDASKCVGLALIHFIFFEIVEISNCCNYLNILFENLLLWQLFNLFLRSAFISTLVHARLCTQFTALRLTVSALL